MAEATPAAKPTKAAKAAAPEAAAPAPEAPKIVTTVEDAPPVPEKPKSALPAGVVLSPKTLAEQAEGRKVLAQYHSNK